MQAGRKTLVLEKSLCQPDRIVGELLQPGGYLMLKKMGLEDCTREIDAQEVYGYALFKGNSAFNILYPTEGFEKDVSGRSFHHGRCEHPAVLHSIACIRIDFVSALSALLDSLLLTCAGLCND